jgi:hypothetical protein
MGRETPTPALNDLKTAAVEQQTQIFREVSDIKVPEKQCND